MLQRHRLLATLAIACFWSHDLQQGPCAVPIDEGAGSGNSCQALTDLLRHIGRAGGAGEFQPQAALAAALPR